MDREKGANGGDISSESLTLSEAASFLGISRPTFYKLLDAGKIKGTKRGKKWKFTKEELNLHLNGGTARRQRDDESIEVTPSSAPDSKKLRELFKVPPGGTQVDPARDAETAAFFSLIAEAMEAGAWGLALQPERDMALVSLRDAVDSYELTPICKATLVGFTERLPQIAEEVAGAVGGVRQGNAGLTYKGRPLNLRYNIYPTIDGDRLSVDLIYHERVLVPLEIAGFRPQALARLKGVLADRSGLVVLTGPTGSGKVTLAYSLLKHLESLGSTVMTAEKDVRMSVSGLNQAKAGEEGFTFADAARAMVRQGADARFFGRLPDFETADLALEAAVEGSLVIAAIHSRSAVGAIRRLLDAGLDAVLLGETLRCVISGRIYRAICPHCRVPRDIESSLREYLVARGVSYFYLGQGCEHCRSTGFSGLSALYETLFITPALEERLKHDASAKTILEASLKAGFIPLEAQVLRVVREGGMTAQDAVKIMRTLDKGDPETQRWINI